MPGKHKGPSRKGMSLNKMTRLALSPEIEKEFLRMVEEEKRSHANLFSILVTEAILARRKKANRVYKMKLKLRKELSRKQEDAIPPLL